jgi:hypothetical protein
MAQAHSDGRPVRRFVSGLTGSARNLAPDDRHGLTGEHPILQAADDPFALAVDRQFPIRSA